MRIHLSTFDGNIQNMDKMCILSKIILILYLIHSSMSLDEPVDYKLEQLQIIFRHGDRVPAETEFFKPDPNRPMYDTYGHGRLTLIGQERCYKIGQMLRKRYDTFLGEYKDNEVYAYSAGMKRTKASLKLVLAALYPQITKSSVDNATQAIPTHSESYPTGFLTASFECPEWRKMFFDSEYSPYFMTEMKKYELFVSHLMNDRGINMTSPIKAWFIYNNLRAALSLGLPFPANLTMEDYREIEKLTAFAHRSLSRDELFRRLMAGPMVERILRNFNENESTKKIYLYSACETNLAEFIDAHNITGAPLIQDYGSTLILEKLRGSDKRIYIRMYLWTGVSEQLIFLKLEHCERTCLLSDYEKIVQSILPNETTRTMCPYSSTIV